MINNSHIAHDRQKILTRFDFASINYLQVVSNHSEAFILSHQAQTTMFTTSTRSKMIQKARKAAAQLGIRWDKVRNITLEEYIAQESMYGQVDSFLAQFTVQKHSDQYCRLKISDTLGVIEYDLQNQKVSVLGFDTIHRLICRRESQVAFDLQTFDGTTRSYLSGDRDLILAILLDCCHSLGYSSVELVANSFARGYHIIPLEAYGIDLPTCLLRRITDHESVPETTRSFLPWTTKKARVAQDFVQLVDEFLLNTVAPIECKQSVVNLALQQVFQHVTNDSSISLLQCLHRLLTTEDNINAFLLLRGSRSMLHQLLQSHDNLTLYWSLCLMEKIATHAPETLSRNDFDICLSVLDVQLPQWCSSKLFHVIQLLLETSNAIEAVARSAGKLLEILFTQSDAKTVENCALIIRQLADHGSDVLDDSIAAFCSQVNLKSPLAVILQYHSILQGRMFEPESTRWYQLQTPLALQLRYRIRTRLLDEIQSCSSFQHEKETYRLISQKKRLELTSQAVVLVSSVGKPLRVYYYRQVNSIQVDSDDKKVVYLNERAFRIENPIQFLAELSEKMNRLGFDIPISIDKLESSTGQSFRVTNNVSEKVELIVSNEALSRLLSIVRYEDCAKSFDLEFIDGRVESFTSPVRDDILTAILAQVQHLVVITPKPLRSKTSLLPCSFLKTDDESTLCFGSDGMGLYYLKKKNVQELNLNLPTEGMHLFAWPQVIDASLEELAIRIEFPDDDIVLVLQAYCRILILYQHEDSPVDLQGSLTLLIETGTTDLCKFWAIVLAQELNYSISATVLSILDNQKNPMVIMAASSFLETQVDEIVPLLAEKYELLLNLAIEFENQSTLILLEAVMTRELQHQALEDGLVLAHFYTGAFEDKKISQSLFGYWINGNPTALDLIQRILPSGFLCMTQDIFQLLKQDHQTPELIWNEITRSELRQSCEMALKGLKSDTKWNHAEFIVSYPSLESRLRVDGFYMTELFRCSEIEIQHPRQLFESLYRTLLKRSDHCVQCVNSMTELAQKYQESIGEFKDMPYLVDLFSTTTDDQMSTALIPLLLFLSYTRKNLIILTRSNQEFFKKLVESRDKRALKLILILLRAFESFTSDNIPIHPSPRVKVQLGSFLPQFNSFLLDSTLSNTAAKILHQFQQKDET